MLTRYRFLPWSRRGLAAQNETADEGGNLSRRGTVSVGIDISNVGAAGVDLSMYGPGDIQGIDTTLIVRTSPRAGSRNSEPNYLAAIDFDPPDFPWMFTPATAGSKQRLRPWLVLVVLDAALVSAPRQQRGRPLPTVRIGAEHSSLELPDLSDSWAWAHTQLVAPTNSSPNLASELRNKPDLNVSRLLCPRRLRPNRSWYACVVPAFDAGVERGLGAIPDVSLPLGPAWTTPNPGEVILPVYYHWEFSTGVRGDFETLASKLRPFRMPDTVGTTSMYIGDAGPELPAMAPSDPRSVIDMDGVLRAQKPDGESPPPIPTETVNALSETLNAPARFLSSGPDNATQALGPPIYGQWHKNQHEIASQSQGWLAELNVNPRTRVAAALGAEIVRAHQQEFMQECWKQVGDIRTANNVLNWARLGFEASRRLYDRHVRPQADDRLLQFAAPLQKRTPFESANVAQRIERSSLPHATTDMAYRRILSPQRPLIRRTLHRLLQDNQTGGSFVEARRSVLVSTLAEGRRDVEPTGSVPDGVTGSQVLGALQGGGLSRVAGVAIAADEVQTLQQLSAPLNGIDFQATPPALKLRDNLELTGLITSEHVDKLRALHSVDSGENTGSLNIPTLLDGVLEQAIEKPGLQGVVVTVDPDKPATLKPVFVRPDGNVLIGVPGISEPVSVGQIDIDALTTNTTIDQMIRRLPPGTLIDGTRVDAMIGQRLTDSLPVDALPGGVVFDRLTTDAPLDVSGPGVALPPSAVDASVTAGQATSVLPAPVRSPAATQLFSTMFDSFRATAQLDSAVAAGRLVAFPLATAAAELRFRMDPVRVVPQRLRQLIRVRERDIWQGEVGNIGAYIPETFDRILNAPRLQAPMYDYLARYSQERFCPGIGAIPPNSMSTLETNPQFIEAFMVGLNHEMNRELLWRRYPTDQRGTPFRQFWRWLDGEPDIDPIHRWPRANALGTHSRGSNPDGQTVLLIRGEVLRRYPNSVLLAWRATPDGKDLVAISSPDSDDLRDPVFMGHLEEDVNFAGFDLSTTDLRSGGGWFFVIQEQPTEPRFGLDVDTAGNGQRAPTSWDEADWSHTNVAPGQYLNMSAAGRLSNLSIGARRFGENGAHTASVLLQKPYRVVVHARHILPVPA